MKKYLLLPWHPFFFACYPALALLAYNLGEVKYPSAIRSLALCLAAAFILVGLLRLACRNLHRAASAASALMVLFFTYGQVIDQASKKWEDSHRAARMIAPWLGLAALALACATLPKVHFDQLAAPLNVVSLALVLYSAVPVVWWSIAAGLQTSGAKYAPLQTPQVAPGQTAPDIYYIMPEDYGRADLIQKAYGYDDSQFLQYLKQAGFFIADCSQSNYVRSELSLGSSLNMAYLQDLDPAFTPNNVDRTQLWNAIRYRAVLQDLEKIGYKTVVFATGFSWSELDNADIYINPLPKWSGITGFETLLLRTTPLRLPQDMRQINFDEIDGERYRQRTLTVFKSMQELAHMPCPKFVFVHMLSPHPPFVFGPDGLPTDSDLFINQDQSYPTDKDIDRMRNQIAFINQMLEKAIGTLLSESAAPPVIILQTDPGPWLQSGSDKFKILNTYYLPGQANALYAGISPVNTFRVVLDAYLGAHYPLLDDISYDSPVPDTFNFSKVPNPCQAH